MHARPICSSVEGERGGEGVYPAEINAYRAQEVIRAVRDAAGSRGGGGMKSAGIKMKFLKLVGNSKFPRRTANARKRNRARDPREVIGSRDQPVRFSLMAACEEGKG